MQEISNKNNIKIEKSVQDDGGYMLSYKLKEGDIDLQVESYTKDGDLRNTLLHLNNKKGKEFANFSYDEGNKIQYCNIYEYDEEGRTIKMTEYQPDRPYCFHIFKHEDSGDIIETVYNMDGTIRIEPTKIEGEWQKNRLR
jgi:hypothetical protein